MRADRDKHDCTLGATRPTDSSKQLAGGWLLGKYRKDREITDRGRRFDPDAAANAAKLDAADALGALADEAGLTLIQMAIAFAVEHPAVTSTIIGPRTMEHLEGYLAADGVTLSTEVLDRIDQIVPPAATINVAEHVAIRDTRTVRDDPPTPPHALKCFVTVAYHDHDVAHGKGYHPVVHSISARRARLTAFVAAAVLGAALPVVTSATPAAADPGNLALGRPITATSVAPFAPYSANDGDPSSYWESPPNLFPQYVTVDLGTARNINRLVLKLPPSWSARTQTITVRGGTTDPSSTVVASRSYAFDPATGNAVTINFGVGYRRNVQLVIEGNSAGPAAQLSEFEVYEAPPVLSANPTSLNFGAAVVATTATAQSVTISNSGGTPGTLAPITVTGDFQRLGGTCGTTLSNGSSCTITVVFKPTATGARTGTLAAGTLSIPLSGTGVTTAPPNWAAFKTVWADYTGVSAGSNAVDRNPNTVWEGPPGAVPQVIMVALGGTYQVSRVVLRIPPAWTARAETLMVQTSPTTNPWVTVADMRQYIFEPATANTVTITFPTVVAGYVQLVFIGNTGSPSAQLSELEVYPL